MLDWKADLERLVEDTTTFAKRFVSNRRCRVPSLNRIGCPYRPSRHPLVFGRLPGFAGYTAYLAPTISRQDEEGFSSCSACPCHRAVASTPPR
jgi:hypothetical protein